ncbi:MAG: GH92 family glycosyl hydrolase [Prevotella sp.]|nr:GH92 family glycosyl hydrolase [Prevotella sp.]
MYTRHILSLLLAILCGSVSAQDLCGQVDRMMGTGGDARVTPVAALPFGMMQIGPDTRPSGSGYHYDDKQIIGFSHLHKSGGGCADFLDILFMPLRPRQEGFARTELRTRQLTSELRHDRETTAPGYYKVQMYGGDVETELTATRRCGLQRYHYRKPGRRQVLIDLEHGSTCGCTIQPEHDVDTVYDAYIEQVDAYTVRGYRKSNGWVYNQHIYFYTTFSSPIRSVALYVDNHRVNTVQGVRGENVKMVVDLDGDPTTVEVKTAISGVDMDGARANLLAEAKDVTFDQVRAEATALWNRSLAQIEVKTPVDKRRRIFYTSLHNVLLYPMLSSDVDFRFRGPDGQIHRTDGFDYYGAVVGLWDTFRAACPLMAVLQPDVMRDYVKTSLQHFRICGQLPIWTLAGQETYQMIGLHSMPLITNCYQNGIRGFDTQLALQAMTTSAQRDTCGYSMGYFVGMQNYKRYGYVPCDLEMEATARTLEYAFDDEAIARFADLIGHSETATHFHQRGQNYRNVIDPVTKLARGRDSHGGWRTPFYPLRSEHRRDDYCEGNAWQWTFFVPHDVEGLTQLMGGKRKMEAKMDSLFSMSSAIEGENASGDISGLIGQYAHGNEPGHHTIYMYNRVGAPKKTQTLVRRILDTLYDSTPTGICGNEDTGQMSAWYVFSALGFYPMDPVSGQYEIGTPSFEEATMHLPSGKDFTVKAIGLTADKCQVKRVLLNGKPLNRTYITFQEVLDGGELVFEMKKTTL